MKNNNKPEMYTNKENGVLLASHSKKSPTDSCLITNENNVPLFRIDLTCFDSKTEALQIAKFKQIITHLTESGII